MKNIVYVVIDTVKYEEFHEIHGVYDSIDAAESKAIELNKGREFGAYASVDHVEYFKSKQ